MPFGTGRVHPMAAGPIRATTLPIRHRRIAEHLKPRARPPDHIAPISPHIDAGRNPTYAAPEPLGVIEQQVSLAGSSLMGARWRQPGIVLVKPDDTGGVNVEHVEAAGRARGDSREGPAGLVDRTCCRSEMALAVSGRLEREQGKRGSSQIIWSWLCRITPSFMSGQSL